MEIYWMLQLSAIFLYLHLTSVAGFLKLLKTASTCYNVSSQQLHLRCQQGELIYIHRVAYGYSSSGSCQYSQGDCLIPDQKRYSCHGQHECSINLPSGGQGMKLDTCKQYSNYMQAEYACIPAMNVHSICDLASLSSGSGYITSPRYPYNYLPNTPKCETRITAHPSQRIKLYLLDLDLPAATVSGCPDDLYINSMMSSQTYCGQRKPTILLEKAPKEVTVTFEITSADSMHKGFWLYYEAYPPLPSTPTPTSTSSTISISTTTVSQGAQQQQQVPPTKGKGGKDDQVQTGPLTKPASHQRQPIAEAIIGTVMGVLFVVVLALLIILLMQRRKAALREQRDSHMLTSPSFDSTSTTCSMQVGHVKNELYSNGKMV